MSEDFNNFSKSITTLKAIAILGIVIIHQPLTAEDFNNSEILIFAFIRLSEIGVDFFTILSGMMLTISLINAKDFTWKQWYKKRLIRIYPILIIVLLFLIIYDIIFGNPWDVNSNLLMMSGLFPIIFIKDLIIIPSYWFIPFLITCYLIFPLIFSSLKKQFKLTIMFGILLYITFIIFGFEIYLFTNKFFFKNELEKGQFVTYVPRYFDFFFGMILGFLLTNNNLYCFSDQRIELLSLISLIIFTFLFFTLFSLILNDEIYFLSRFLFFPLMSLSFIILFINFNRNRNILNKVLEFPGKISYEMYLLNYVAIDIVFIFIIPGDITFLFFIIILCYIITILLATPFYCLNKHMTNKKKVNNLFLIIILSSIIYALIFFLISRKVDFTNLFSCILISIIFIITFINYFNIQKFRNLKKIRGNLIVR